MKITQTNLEIWYKPNPTFFSIFPIHSQTQVIHDFLLINSIFSLHLMTISHRFLAFIKLSQFQLMIGHRLEIFRNNIFFKLTRNNINRKISIWASKDIRYKFTLRTI